MFVPVQGAGAGRRTVLASNFASLVALGTGLLVAMMLAWYLSRRIARPVLALSAAADRIADLLSARPSP